MVRESWRSWSRSAERLAVASPSTRPCRRLAYCRGRSSKKNSPWRRSEHRLGEAWSLLHERVELCRQQDAAAQAERQEALRFAKETRDSVKQEAQEVMDQLDAAREALEAETASRQQEVAAQEQSSSHSKTGRGLKEPARGWTPAGQLTHA